MTAGAGVSLPRGLLAPAAAAAVSDRAPSIRLHYSRWGNAAVYGQQGGRAAGGRGPFMPSSGRESCTADSDFGSAAGMCRLRRLQTSDLAQPAGSELSFRCNGLFRAVRPLRQPGTRAGSPRGVRPSSAGPIAPKPCAVQPDVTLSHLSHNSIRQLNTSAGERALRPVVDLQGCASTGSLAATTRNLLRITPLSTKSID